jgi:hypothetical protein
MIDGNSPAKVESSTTNALKHLKGGRWKEAMKDVTDNLKGVGTATATALLAPFAPDLIPFMADEVIESATDLPRDYTDGVYEKVRQALTQKAATLNAYNIEHKKNMRWTLEDVGRAIWVKAVGSALNVSVPSTARDKMPVPSSGSEGTQGGPAKASSKRKRGV